MESLPLKDIQNRLLQWESLESPLAALTPAQREAITDLEALISDSTAEEQVF